MRLSLYAGADENLSKTLHKRMCEYAVIDKSLDKDRGYKTFFMRH